LCARDEAKHSAADASARGPARQLVDDAALSDDPLFSDAPPFSDVPLLSDELDAVPLLVPDEPVAALDFSDVSDLALPDRA